MAVGPLFHLAHTVDNAADAQAWYRDVLGAREFLPLHTLEAEKRDAALLAVADAVLEPVSPTFGLDGWEQRPFGRYYQRFGTHWHSIAWYTDSADDPAAVWERGHAAGVRMFGLRGALTGPPAPGETVFTHPKDTVGQLQFTPLAGSRYESLDPRLRPGWDSAAWRTGHPLGLVGLAHVAVLVSDLAAAVRVYVDVLGAAPRGRGECPLTGTAFADVELGGTVLRLSVPRAGGTLAAADLATTGPGPHAVVWRVADLDRAAEHLTRSGVRLLDRDATTLLTAPATTLGVPFRWTTEPPG